MYEKKCIQFLHDWSHFSSLKPLLPIHHSKLDRQELLYPCKRKKWLFCCGGGLGRVLQTYIFPKRQVLNLTATITWNWRKSHFATLKTHWFYPFPIACKNDEIEFDKEWFQILGVEEILRQVARKTSHEESWNQMGPYGLWGTWRPWWMKSKGPKNFQPRSQKMFKNKSRKEFRW